MKNLKSKLFQKFEINRVKNLSRITGGTNWVKSYGSHGGTIYHDDYMDLDSFNTGAVIPPGDRKGLSSSVSL